jgi:hypothetical protein
MCSAFGFSTATVVTRTRTRIDLLVIRYIYLHATCSVYTSRRVLICMLTTVNVITDIQSVTRSKHYISVIKTSQLMLLVLRSTQDTQIHGVGRT